MKRLPLIAFLVICMAVLSACKMSTWDTYTDWRNENMAYVATQQERIDETTGKPYYTKVVPSWDASKYVLIHWFNDTMKTKDNLQPFVTSTVDVKYYGKNIYGAAFDSSYTSTSPADSIYRATLTNVVDGWKIALMKMHVGDTVEVVVPYESGYGSASTGSLNPYSTLVFGIKFKRIESLYKK